MSNLNYHRNIFLDVYFFSNFSKPDTGVQFGNYLQQVYDIIADMMMLILLLLSSKILGYILASQAGVLKIEDNEVLLLRCPGFFLFSSSEELVYLYFFILYVLYILFCSFVVADNLAHFSFIIFHCDIFPRSNLGILSTTPPFSSSDYHSPQTMIWWYLSLIRPCWSNILVDVFRKNNEWEVWVGQDITNGTVVFPVWSWKMNSSSQLAGALQ